MTEKAKFSGAAEELMQGKRLESKERGAESDGKTPSEKAVKAILKKAGLSSPVPLRDIMRGKTGSKVKISDIAIFIDKPKDAALKSLAEMCPVVNRVNLSAEVEIKRVVAVGANILSSGRMFHPIFVARIKEDGRLECTSGRHRLAFLALMYGTDAEVPVYIEDMSLNEARDAVAFANDTRKIQPLERAEYTVLKAMQGNVDAEIDEMYAKTVTSKARMKEYCVFCVFDKGYPAKLEFAVSREASRKGGELTTLTNMRSYWGASVAWRKMMPRKDFDALFKASIRFINVLVDKMTAIPGFSAYHHLSERTLAAVGKYYADYNAVSGKNAVDVVDAIAKAVVSGGECGSVKSSITYEQIAKALQKK